MKLIKSISVLMLLFCGIASYSQNYKPSSKDSSITFKVFGACIQCKNRIEEAVKSKGVKSANWDIDTKQLSLVYNPAQISLDKIQNRIVAVGHDLENKKSKNNVYAELPACCHYREMETMMNEVAADTMKIAQTDTTAIINMSEVKSVSHIVKGVVLESNKQGVFTPLVGASVVWLGTNNGTFTDTTGVFSIKHDGTSSRLIISYTSYRSDTLTVTDMKELKIILASDKKLGEVIVKAKQRSIYLSAINPIRTQIMTDKELFKAACCNLSESFETNPSVDVSYNDAVTGSKQIQLLGLSGNYTQLTVENLPGPRGIATPLGLNSIAGPWVESIQLTKGIGSVANGFESIAGQINVELKKPENSEKLYANAYINDFGKTDLNLNLSTKIGKKWSTGLLLHDDFLTNQQLDFNKDGFRDLPMSSQ